MSLITDSQEKASGSTVTDILEQDIKEVLLIKKGPNKRPLRRQSLEDEGLEIKFPEDSEVDFDVVKTVSLSRRRRARSSVDDVFDHVYNDSGFNSSDDDKDDVPDSCFDTLSLGSSISRANSIDITDLAVYDNINTDCTKNCDKDEGIRTSVSINTLQNITDNSTDPDIMSSVQLVHSSSVNALVRCRHGRRRRIIDSNNNDTVVTVSRLHSYLKPPPFKLNECFQDKGLFCLMVCIAYTLLLFFVLGCVGVFMDIIRSALTKDDLAEIRARFPPTRHRRTNVTSG